MPQQGILTVVTQPLICVCKRRSVFFVSLLGLNQLVMVRNILFCCALVLGSGLCASAQTVSTRNGNWNDPGMWSPAVVPDFNSGTITVNHIATILNGVTVVADQITVGAAGGVTVDSGGILTINNGTGNDLVITPGSQIIISGTLESANLAVISGSTATTTSFLSGGRYRHLYTTTTGNLPLATWNSNSTLELAGYTTASAASGSTWSQNFGNVEWNCTAQSFTFNLNGLLTSVAGNFSVLSTGTNGIVRFATNQNPTVNIAGSLLISGTSYVQLLISGVSPGGVINIGNDFVYTSTNANGSFMTSTGVCTVNIADDFIVNAPGGNIRMASGASGTGKTTVNIGGDFILTAGQLSENEAEPGEGVFVFTGVNQTHLFTNTGSITGRIGYIVPASNTVQFTGESSMVGGTTSYLTLSGNLILSSANSAGAIQTGFANGNVRTGTRTFNSGSTLVYGGSAAQVIGNGQPNDTNLTTVINNASGVSLNNTSAASTTIKKLQLLAGTLTVANDDLVIDESLAIDGGTLQLTSASAARSLTVNGSLSRSAGLLQVSSGVNTATLVMNGSLLGGTDYVTYLGSNSNLSIGGTGSLGAAFPFSGATTLRTLNVNRSGAIVLFNDALNTTNVNLTAGSMDIDATMIISGNLNMASGTGLLFQDQVVELRGLLNNTLTGGLLSSNSTSTLNIFGSGTLGTLAFNGGANTIGTLSLNRPTAGNLVTLNSALTIATNFNLTDGDFLNSSGLTLSSGATVNRNSNGSLNGTAPLGGAYNVNYTGSSITAGQELQGLLSTVTLAIAGNLNSGLPVSMPGNLILTSGTWINSGGLAMGASSSITRSSSSSPMTGSIPTGGPYDLTYTGTSISTGVEARGLLDVFTINVSGTATINTSVSVSGTLDMVQGAVSNTNVLTMGNGATISRNSATSFTGNSPLGGPYNLSYSGSTLTTGTERSGSIANVTINTSGLVTLNNSLNAVGTLQINTGSFTAGNNALTVQAIVNNGTFTASSGTTTLSGNFQNNSTFNSNAGIFSFTGNTTLSGASPITFNTVVITGSLTSSALFRLTGNFTNNGTFVNNSGSIEFLGSGTQLISGAETTFNNITSFAPLLSIESNQNLSGRLTLNNGSVLDADGSTNTSVFTLLSTADAPSTGGTIGPLLNGASVSGSITGRRFMSAEGVLYRYISSFVTNATVASWQDDFLITGSFSQSDFPCGGLCSTNGSSITYYNESVIGSSSLGYTGVPSSSNTENILPGVGYRSYMWGGASQITWNLTGPINQGSIVLPVSYTPSVPPNANNDGWNLVGNPYPSAIRWDNSANWSKTNISGTVYVTDNSSGSQVYRFYNANTLVGDLPNGEIAMGQSFWVRATAAPSLTIQESAKVTNSGNFYRIGNEVADHFIISLTDGATTDNCFVAFADGATAFYDHELDGYKLKNEKLNIFTLTEKADELAINTLAGLEGYFSLPITIEVEQPGEFQLKIVNNLVRNRAQDLFLYDAEEGSYYRIAENTAININLSGTSSTDRFYITTSNDKVNNHNTGVVASLFPNPASSTVNLQVSDKDIEIVSVLLHSVTGKSIGDELVFQNDDHSFEIGHLAAGMYVVRIVTNKGVFVKTLVKE
jgi:hypothetical protein